MEGWLSYGDQCVALKPRYSLSVRPVYWPRRYVPARAAQPTRVGHQASQVSADAGRLPKHNSGACHESTSCCSIETNSKPYQQQLIVSHGFLIPRTIITTVPEEARHFYDTCDGRVVYKSI